MKGVIKPDHSPSNKFAVIVVGLTVPQITPTTMGSLEDELNKAELPDRTAASGGESAPTELEVTIPVHHKGEMAAMEAWYRESKDPVSPTYKKAATFVYYTISGGVAAAYAGVGVFPSKRALPEQDMEGEGEMGVCTWTLSIDDHQPIG